MYSTMRETRLYAHRPCTSMRRCRKRKRPPVDSFIACVTGLVAMMRCCASVTIRASRLASNTCAANTVDAQAAYESANTMWSTLLSGVNFCLHAAGWLEGGLASGYEKLIMDADQLTMYQKFAQGVDFSENGQALDAIREVGPGSHYLGCAHTQANFETAFWRSSLADNNSFEQWRDEGEKDIVVRANERWKQMLRDYEAPPLDQGIDDQLVEFMAKRKEVLPDNVS